MTSRKKSPAIIDRRVLLKHSAAVGIARGLESTPATKPAAADGDAPFIVGYTDRSSYCAGEKVNFHISTTAPQFALEIARLAARREVVGTVRGLPGAQHAVPENASTDGCRWPVTTTVPVSGEWRSGYYSVILR
jgi:hypothetical protein